MRILGIDDNEDINEMLAMTFDGSGHEFSYALRGLDGLRLIRENQYDVILLDLAMPEFSGIDVLNTMEQEGLLSKQKVIILTASTIIDREFEQFKKRGISECIRKPVDLDELLQKVEEIASRK